MTGDAGVDSGLSNYGYKFAKITGGPPGGTLVITHNNPDETVNMEKDLKNGEVSFPGSFEFVPPYSYAFKNDGEYTLTLQDSNNNDVNLSITLDNDSVGGPSSDSQTFTFNSTITSDTTSNTGTGNQTNEHEWTVKKGWNLIGFHTAGKFYVNDDIVSQKYLFSYDPSETKYLPHAIDGTDNIGHYWEVTEDGGYWLKCIGGGILTFKGN